MNKAEELSSKKMVSEYCHCHWKKYIKSALVANDPTEIQEVSDMIYLSREREFDSIVKKQVSEINWIWSLRANNDRSVVEGTTADFVITHGGMRIDCMIMTDLWTKIGDSPSRARLVEYLFSTENTSKHHTICVVHRDGRIGLDGNNKQLEILKRGISEYRICYLSNFEETIKAIIIKNPRCSDPMMAIHTSRTLETPGSS